MTPSMSASIDSRKLHTSAPQPRVLPQNKMAQLYLQNIFKLHGLPHNIISDRGTQFTSKFTRRLLELCDIKSNKSTAYHPQSDGQTECVNQVLEQYLHIFCDYQQDDWYHLLQLA